MYGRTPPTEQEIDMTRRKIDRRRTLTGIAGLTAATTLLPRIAIGQADWPKQPIRILVGFAAGGGNDVFARMVAQRLSERLGVSVVVENRAGAGSIIAFEQTARAAADGYTIVIAPFGATIVNPAVYAKLPYDPAALLPLSIVASFPFVMVVRSDLPVKSIAELVEYAKKHPDKANYGTPSVTFQLLVELFKSRTGAPFEHIPFKGTNEVLTALLNGQLMMSFVDPGPLIGHLKGGRVKAFAHSGSERFPHLPDVPTMAEAGFPGIVMDSFMGFMAPRALPEPVAKRLEAEFIAMARDKDFAEKIRHHGLVPVGSTSKEFADRIARETPMWKDVAQKAKIQLK
jgi:tripartite-type tricarboxylate transporter receptor subunit TctC